MASDARDAPVDVAPLATELRDSLARARHEASRLPGGQLSRAEQLELLEELGKELARRPGA